MHNSKGWLIMMCIGVDAQVVWPFRFILAVDRHHFQCTDLAERIDYDIASSALDAKYLVLTVS